MAKISPQNPVTSLHFQGDGAHPEALSPSHPMLTCTLSNFVYGKKIFFVVERPVEWDLPHFWLMKAGMGLSVWRGVKIPCQVEEILEAVRALTSSKQFLFLRNGYVFMIAKLSGRVDQIKENFLILDVQGVGYKVFCSQKTLSQVHISDSLVLYIETIVREDAFLLYGFTRESEQAWFILFMTVQGVGTRVALAILSACQEDTLAQAILSQDVAYMTQAEGVGPKLATRIIHELKSKVENVMPLSLGEVSSSPLSKGPVFEDAVSALVNLGYRRLDVTTTLQKLSSEQEILSVDNLIRQGLKILSESRR